VSLEVCPACSTRFAVGLFRCPQCRATAPLFADRVEKESKMARITVAGGPSNAAAQPGEPGYVEQPAEVSLVAITGEHGPDLVGFAGRGTTIPIEALTDQQDGEPVAAPEQPAKAAPASKRTSARKGGGGAS
jgi:hypothetical protein